MPFRRMLLAATALVAVAALAQPPAPQPAAPQPPSPPLSSAAERVYDAARPRIIQVRTLLAVAGRQSTIGSGFIVSEDGLAVTNYHVVSQFVLEPRTYRLEYAAPDGGSGALTVLAIDVPSDLAVVRLDRGGWHPLEFEPRALDGRLTKGERLFSMGNPLDLGFTIVEGTYNGLVDKSYDERIHFSGAINAGMSGGPTENAAGRIVGVNVAKRLDGENVGFLVPARKAAALLERARNAPPLALDKAREEVGRQLDAWQASFHEALLKEGFRPGAYGPYRGLESAAPWVTCWASTNADEVPKPRVATHATQCTSGSALFVSDRILTGRLQLSYTYYRAVDVNSFQFAHAVSQRTGAYDYAGRRLTGQECRDDFIGAGAQGHPPLRATWCMRAYRDFEGLYNVTLLAVTQDRADEALVTQLVMQGVSHANAMALGKRILEAIEWRR